MNPPGQGTGLDPGKMASGRLAILTFVGVYLPGYKGGGADKERVRHGR